MNVIISITNNISLQTFETNLGYCADRVDTRYIHFYYIIKSDERMSHLLSVEFSCLAWMLVGWLVGGLDDCLGNHISQTQVWAGFELTECIFAKQYSNHWATGMPPPLFLPLSLSLSLSLSPSLSPPSLSISISFCWKSSD